MHRPSLRTLALVSCTGLLTACPLPEGTTTVTATDDSTGEPTGTGTTAEPTTSAPTTESQTSTEPTGDTVDPTAGPETEGATETAEPTTGEPPTVALCEHLGEIAGITDLVQAAVGKVLVDERINGYFLNADVDGGALVSCLVEQIGALADCRGVDYSCKTMADAHAGLGISTVDFSDFVMDFQAALDEHQADHPALTDADKAYIIGELEKYDADIIEDPTNDGTVYQRIGRKPEIRTLVGQPGQVETFVDNVVNDDSLSGYFLNTDFERFNTCLTRQIGDIDGPIDYGQEVDAPPPADPGVTAAEPCLDMATAHEGLVDPNDPATVGIDINDFLALVTHLVDAMDTFSVAPDDQQVILDALGATCEEILAPSFKNQCPSAQKQVVVEVADLNQMLSLGLYDGNPASMTCVELEVADDGFNFVDTLELTVGITHPWVADLTIKVISPGVMPDGAKLLTVVSRPGLNEPKDNGMGCCGKNANLDAAVPLHFRDGAKNEAELMGTVGNLGDNQTVCVDDGVDPCEWDPSPGKGPGVAFTDFHGVAAPGLWKVCVGDSEVADPGVLQSAKLTVHKLKYDPAL